MLEIQRRRLNQPPLGPQEYRNPEEMELAETRTEAPLSEYIETREKHLARTAFEVLNISGLSFEDSASLVETIYSLHREQWDRDEDSATLSALETMTVPTTPFDRSKPDPVLETLRNAPVEDIVLTEEQIEQHNKALREYKEGRFVSFDLLMLDLDGKIPHLRVVPLEDQE